MLNEEINLKNEIFERYNELIPEKEVGLIVFSIYSKIKRKEIDKQMSYKDLTNAIDDVWKGLKISYQKGIFQKYEEILLVLRKHFIDKDDKTNNYTLTDYAEQFCRFIEEEVQNILKPSEIELIFNNLLLILKDNILTFDKFEIWYKKEFSPKKNDISSQVRALRKQAEKAQNVLNEIMNLDNDYFEMLKKTEDQIDEIQTQNQKIIKSFSVKDDIKTMLDETDLASIKKFRIIRTEIRNFFREIDRKLISVSEIIDTTKPKIYKLYQDIEKKQIDKKLEKFLSYVLQNSTNNKFTVKQLKNKTIYDTQIELPTEINHDKLIIPQPDKFIKTEYFEFTEPNANETQEPDFDLKENQLQIEKRRKQLETNKKIEFWYNKVHTKIGELNVGDSILFTAFFFEILASEKNNVEIAIKVANKIFTDFSNNDRFQVEVNKQFEISQKINDIALWQMKITKSNY